MEGSILIVNNTDKITNHSKTALLSENFTTLKEEISKDIFGNTLKKEIATNLRRFFSVKKNPRLHVFSLL